MTAVLPVGAETGAAPSLPAVLGDEGFRLFFPLAALHAALWPVLWVVVFGFDLPFARVLSPGLWHAQEMLIGAYGAALIGFLTTAIPEWTDSARLRGRALYALALLWAVPRLVGIAGLEALVPLAALCDALWLGALLVYVLSVSLRRRTTRLLGFGFWLAALLGAVLVVRLGFHLGDAALAHQALRITVLVFVGLVGLALARITVPVTNLVLDPTERSSPFRPHPGRRNLAPGLAALAIAGELAGASGQVSGATTGFLWIAAGAAFLDRVAEAFVGRESARAEIMALAGASALTGLGLLLVGAGRLGAPVPETTAIHVIVMGGLGLAVLAVFAIAGRLHTGRPLGLDRTTRCAFLALLLAVLLRVGPDLGWFALPGPAHAISSVVWAAAFLLWLAAYWPALSDPRTLGARTC